MPSSQSVVQLLQPVDTHELQSPPVHVLPQSSSQSVPQMPQPLSSDVHTPPVQGLPQSSSQVVPQVPQLLSTASQSPPVQAPQSFSQFDWQIPQPLSPLSSPVAQSPPEQAPHSFWQSLWQIPQSLVSSPESPMMMTGLSAAASFVGKMILPPSGIPGGMVTIVLVTEQRVMTSICGNGQLVT
jgi:hypothetical protein